MIDLHCHLVPGMDDGAPDIETSLAMARMAVEDGITDIACTPHITPGVYDNTGAGIEQAVERLRAELERSGIELGLWIGADVHVDPELPTKLAQGTVPTLAGTRYFLLEPPHDVVPPQLHQLVKALLEANYVPIITHPERLTWIESHFSTVERLVGQGALMQLTAGSITGQFGARPKYWSERMLEAAMVDVIATDAHNLAGRRPNLSRARDVIVARLGDQAAHELTYERPAKILRDEAVVTRFVSIAPQRNARSRRTGLWRRAVRKWLQK